MPQWVTRVTLPQVWSVLNAAMTLAFCLRVGIGAREATKALRLSPLIAD